MAQKETTEWRLNGRIIRSFFFIFIGWLGLSYILVFDWSFMPYGYELISKENHEVTVVHLNLLGQEDEVISKDFSEEPNPNVANYITQSIEDLRFSYFLAIFVMVMSTILLFYEIRVKKNKVWKSIFNSGFIVNLLPFITVAQRLDSINQYMS